MTARKKVHASPCSENLELREQIKNKAAKEKDAEVLLKDCHLLEAALETDKLIVALDETVRQLLHEVVKHLGQFGNIVWVNPAKPEESAVDWIRRGAKAEKDRRLGASQEER